MRYFLFFLGGGGVNVDIHNNMATNKGKQTKAKTKQNKIIS